MKYLSVFLVFVLTTCAAPVDRNAAKDEGIFFNDYGFSDENPYSTADLADANEFLNGKISEYRVERFFEIYFVPLKRTNRLVLVVTAPDYSQARHDLKRLGSDLEQFLRDRLEAKHKAKPMKPSEGVRLGLP
jgi:hypothetical protein